ncbi:hypothetical protein ACEWY4_027364 [Coilia grayii]|uniref:SNARE-complex protein Syntaxin-18 N-terminal domain-containing protein n=1 Tax=Coilia grayii TaxID=363190 RepID=A0ABD1IUE7_9TELE
MAVDITLLFKASVKTVKTRNKAIGLAFDSQKEELLKRSRPSNGFSFKAKEVISNITKLKDFLLQHRKDYVNLGRWTSTFVSGAMEKCSHVTWTLNSMDMEQRRTF